MKVGLIDVDSHNFYFAHLVEQAAAALTALTEENDKIWALMEQGRYET